MKYRSSIALYWVVGTLLLAMLPQLATMPVVLIALTLAPVAWRLAAEWRGWRPFNLFLRILVTAVATAVLVLHYGGLFGRRAAVGLLCLMLAIKLLETFRVRDERVVSCMALFLCMTQFLFAQGLLMLCYGALCLVGALVTLTLLNRKASFSVARQSPERGKPWAELAFSARLLAIAVPFALALFLFFPRWGSPLWGVPEEALDARTGLSDTMSPGTIESLFMDDSPAFRVQFEGVAPRNQQLYWRGPVMWHFDGLSWSFGFFGRNVPAETRPKIADARWRYTVQLEPTEQHWLYALDYPAVVPRGARLTLDYQLYNRRPVTGLMQYEMASDPDFIDNPELKTTIRMTALELPEAHNPRTLEMMARWREETPDDAQLVRRTLAYFNQEEFHYTLNPPLLTRHTVDEFLFETRAGFCEHYASAFTVMMRAAGIPARVVTGYQGGWASDLGNYLLVRQSDAHAWSEVWLPGSGWTRVDPTAAVAPSRIESNALDALGERRYLFDFAWVRSARNSFDLLERHWNDWIIAFDAARQSRLFNPFGIDALSPRTLVLILALVTAGLCLLLVPVILRLRRAGGQDRAARLWADFRERLVRAGVAATPSLGPLELAGVAVRKLPERQAEIEAVTSAYLRFRYAGVASGPQEFEQAWRAFRARR